MENDKENKGNGPKYWLNIENKKYPWEENTITAEEIIQLGGWESGLGAIVIDLKTNIERALQPGEIVEIKPGQGFAKKVRFKRG